MTESETPLRHVILATVSFLALMLTSAGSATAAVLFYSGQKLAFYLVGSITVLLVIFFGIAYVATTTTLWKAIGFGALSSAFAAGSFVLAFRSAATPSYIVESYIATVTVQDVFARQGQLQIRKEILATRGGFKELRLPNLGAEGDVVDFNVDVLGKEFYLEKTKTAGFWHGRILFRDAIKPGEHLTVNAVIGTVDESATMVKKGEVVYAHTLIWERVERLELSIVAPPQRPCNESRAWSIDPKETRREIALQDNLSRGTVLTMHVENPDEGWQFLVECTLQNTVTQA